MLRPRTFFGQAYHSHNNVFGCPPSKELAFEFIPPISLSPWSVFYTPPRKIDIHQQFRRCLREKAQNLQLYGITPCIRKQEEYGCDVYRQEKYTCESSLAYAPDIQQLVESCPTCQR